MASGIDRPAVRLARRLRDLREHEWQDVAITQLQLAKAFSTETPVAAPTLSSWESVTNPKTPPTARLSAYARFFATRKSAENGSLRLVPVKDLDDDERKRFKDLEEELYALHAPLDQSKPPPAESRRMLLAFDNTGPVVIICPEAPKESQGPLADESDVNYTLLHKYADLDALIEIFGHIRALNPDIHVLHRIPPDVKQNELQIHRVLLGGIGWNHLARRIQSELRKLPIEQFDDGQLKGGDVFRVKKVEGREEQVHLPVTVEDNGTRELVEDIALLARLPNPFNSSRTLTICNGIHSKGVVGAVMAVTDETVRPANERYLAARFPAGEFAMLIKVPVVSGSVLAPDLQNPDTRVFEWQPEQTTTGA